MKRLNVVSIVGGADCTSDERLAAEEVGYQLASHGVVILTGGRGGVMEAASKGAQEAGGITVGVLPGGDHLGGNDYLSIAIPTGLGEGRNVVVALAGHVVIAIGGTHGTLSEIAHALRAGRRVIGLNTWTAVDKGGEHLDLLIAQSADEAVNLALKEVGV